MEARGILLAAKLHVLPESWLYGLADVRAMANGMPSFFFGHVYAHGVWFYFPVLLTIKATLGLLLLLVLSVAAILTGRLRGHARELLFLLLPPALYLVVAMTSHLNIGARHVLPLWVFGCLLAGAGAAAWLRSRNGAGQRATAWVVGALFAMHIGSSLAAAPNYIAYANEAWGGPKATYRYLSDSNTDWGQQLKATSEYLQARGVKQCWFAYFVAPFLLPEDYGIPCKLLPTFDGDADTLPAEVPTEIDGPVLISAGDLNGFEFGSSLLNPYESFRSLKPVAHIQDGVLVFEGHFAVPMAASLAHVKRSDALLEAKDVAGALREGKAAASLLPGYVLAEISYGSALGAAGQKTEAHAAFDRALATVRGMDADAQAYWNDRIAGLEKKYGC